MQIERLSFFIGLLTASDNGCLNSVRQPVLKFSKSFLERIESMAASNYKIAAAKVNFIIYWHRESTQQELVIVLPKLYFEKI